MLKDACDYMKGSMEEDNWGVARKEYKLSRRYGCDCKPLHPYTLLRALQHGAILTIDD